jgi:hypothetical protein
VMATDWPAPVTNFEENITGHEIGHILGRGKRFTIGQNIVPTEYHNMIGPDYLMYRLNSNTTPCKISRDDWNMMNWVSGTPILGKDGKSH